MAVKAELTEKKQLPFECRIYWKLRAVDREAISESDDCIPSVYHCREELKVGRIAINVMFMQLLGMTMANFIETNKCSTTEMILMGLMMVIADIPLFPKVNFKYLIITPDKMHCSCSRSRNQHQ